MHELPDPFAALRAALCRAQTDDVEYSEHDIRVHSDRREVKTGYKPIAVLGHAIPPQVVVAYVEGADGGGPFWYVVSSVGGPQREIEATSREAARTIVLGELRAWVEATPPGRVY
jgi:hypothetical protein